jgi:hypothetical protein
MIDRITLLRAEAAGLPAAESHPGEALVCFPLRMDWERTLPPVGAEPWPEPEAQAIEVDGTAYANRSALVSLIKLAESLEWSARVTFARGSYPGVGQRPSRQRASFAVRFRRGPDAAVAVYAEGPSEGSSWSWELLIRRPGGHFAAPDATITAFVDGLAGPVVARPTLADAGLGPMHGPKIMPRGFLNKLGPVHGPEAPPFR